MSSPVPPRRSKSSADYQHIARPVIALSDEYPARHSEPPHSHPRAQLLFACSGVMSVVTPECAFVVPPQRAVWLPRDVEHSIYCRVPVSLRTLYIDPTIDARLPRKCGVLAVSPLLRALILEAMILPAEYDVNGRAGRIMDFIVEEIATTRAAPLQAPMPADERLARFCRELFENPLETKRLDDLARAAGMSRRSLTRMFRRETGMSVAAWRQHVRLLEALSQLGTGRSVTSVALDVGYQSPSSFTTMFRRVFGVTPRRYFTNQQRD